MKSLLVNVEDSDVSQLQELAAGRQLSPEALVERWVRERLAHERERAAGGGRPMSPRARREAEE